MNKKKYESPFISRNTVEVESGFMSASIIDQEVSGKGVTIEGHEVTHEYGFENDQAFSENNKWD